MAATNPQHKPQPPANVSVVRRATEGVLGGLRLTRHLPTASGGAPLIVSGRVGGLKYLFKRAGDWDPQLLRVAALLVRSGDSVWDIGANVGLFSSASAFHAGSTGTVLALEADLDAVSLLNRTFHQQPAGHAEVTVIPVAISSQCGFIRFDISRRARASNAIHGYGTTQTGGVRESRTLPCVTLDKLLEQFRAPDVLKIDAEGAELEVLRGAEQLITRVRPAVYCEVQRDTLRAAETLLGAARYDFFDGDHFNGRADAPTVSANTCNLLAIPHEKRERFVRA